MLFRLALSVLLVQTLLVKAQLVPIDVPLPCQPVCNPAQDAVNACGDDTCFCTDAILGGLGTCFDCVAFFLPSEASDAQLDIDVLVRSCQAEGFNVTPIDITPSSFAGPVATGTRTGTTRSGAPGSTVLSFSSPVATFQPSGTRSVTGSVTIQTSLPPSESASTSLSLLPPQLSRSTTPAPASTQQGSGNRLDPRANMVVALLSAGLAVVFL